MRIFEQFHGEPADVLLAIRTCERLRDKTSAYLTQTGRKRLQRAAAHGMSSLEVTGRAWLSSQRDFRTGRFMLP